MTRLWLITWVTTPPLMGMRTTLVVVALASASPRRNLSFCLNDESESIADGFIKISIKKELNFKDKPDDGTVYPPEIIFPDYVTDIPKLYRKKT